MYRGIAGLGLHHTYRELPDLTKGRWCLVKLVRSFTPAEMEDLDLSPAMPILMEVLRAPDPDGDQRWLEAGLVLLGRFDTPGRAAVFAAATDPDAEVRWRATRLLAMLRLPPSVEERRRVEALIRLASDTEPRTQAEAVHALRGVRLPDGRLRDVMLRALTCPVPSARGNAAEWLVDHVPREQLLRYARPLLTHQDEAVQRSAVFIIARLHDWESYGQLLPLLQRSDAGLVVETVWTLGGAWDPSYAGPIGRLLVATNRLIRFTATQVLQAHLPRTQVLGLVRPLLRHQDPGVRATAAQTIIRLDDKDSADEMIPLLKERDPRVAAGVAEFLLRYGQPRAMRTLTNLVARCSDPNFRYDLLRGMYEIGGPPALEPVVGYIKELPSAFKWKAAGWLARGGRPAAVELYLQLLHDPSGARFARQGLVELTGKHYRANHPERWEAWWAKAKGTWHPRIKLPASAP